MKKVGIYLRLSDEDKNKNEYDNSKSIINQRELLKLEIDKHSDFILYDEYCDEDISGAGSYRPEFERLINDCKNHKIDIVMCKTQSRFSRDMEIIEKYIHNKFIEWNIRFISIVDNADTDNIGNKKVRQINGLVNEWFLEDISNNIKGAFKAKMKKGEFISPFAAYGYKISKINNNKLIIDKNTSIIVKKIYELYLNGYSLNNICKYLDNNNIPSPSYYKYLNNIKLNINSNKKREDIKWNTNTIKNILSNELYIGNLIQGKKTTVSYKNHKIINNNYDRWIKVNNTHKNIIDKNTFFKVQKILKKKTKTKIKNNNYELSGKVFCEKCNKNMIIKSNNKYIYYFCKTKNCNHSIKYEVLKKYILNTINNHLDDLCLIKLNSNIVNILIDKIIISDIVNNSRFINIYWNN